MVIFLQLNTFRYNLVTCFIIENSIWYPSLYPIYLKLTVMIKNIFLNMTFFFKACTKNDRTILFLIFKTVFFFFNIENAKNMFSSHFLHFDKC